MSHFVTCKIKWDHCVYGNAWSKALLPEAAVKVEMLKTVAVLLLLLPLLLLLWWLLLLLWLLLLYQGADKSLARPGRKQTWKHVRDTWIFNNIETQAVIKFLSLQGKAPKEIHTVLTETLACFVPGRAKDLSASLYYYCCYDCYYCYDYYYYYYCCSCWPLVVLPWLLLLLLLQ